MADTDNGNGEADDEEQRHQLRRINDNELLATERQTARAVARVESDVRLIKEQIKTINKAQADTNKLIEEKLVTKDQFNPVKLIAYGFAGATFMSVLGAILATVVQHSTK